MLFRPSPYDSEPWTEFIINWGNDALRFCAWQILLTRRRILTKRKARKNAHNLTDATSSFEPKQIRIKRQTKEVEKEVKNLNSHIKRWNTLIYRLEAYVSAEETFECRPLASGSSAKSLIEEESVHVIHNALGQFYLLDDNIPEFLVTYPALKS